MIGAGVHERRDAADGRDLDDVPAALLAQVRQRRLGHPERPEHVRLQLCPDLGLADLLHHAELPVAGVVHHNVQPPEPLMRLPYRGERASRSVTSSLIGKIASPYFATRSSSVARFRAVAATFSPRSRAAIAHSRPKPGDVPGNPRLHPMPPAFIGCRCPQPDLPVTPRNADAGGDPPRRAVDQGGDQAGLGGHSRFAATLSPRVGIPAAAQGTCSSVLLGHSRRAGISGSPAGDGRAQRGQGAAAGGRAGGVPSSRSGQGVLSAARSHTWSGNNPGVAFVASTAMMLEMQLGRNARFR